MRRRGAYKALAVSLLALLFILAVTEASWPDWPEEDVDADQVPGIPTNEDVGKALFGTDDVEGYGLAVLFVGLLLLVAMLGGIFLAKEESE